MRLPPVAVAGFLIGLLHAPPLPSQCPKPAPVGRYPMATVRALSTTDVDSLRGLLRFGPDCWAYALSFYYRDTYLPTLAELVVFIRSDGRVDQALIWNDKVVTRHVLRGQRSVYVTVFSERPLQRGCCAAARRGAGWLRIHRSSLDQQADPFLSRFVLAIVGKFVTIGGEARDTVPRKDSVVALEDLGHGANDADHLYMTWLRLPVEKNTWNRVSVYPDSGGAIPGTHHIVSNFANADGSYFSAGVGPLWTVNARTVKNDTVVGQQWRMNLYVLAHVQVPGLRATLPRDPMSVSIVLGTNITGPDFLSELLLGVSMNRLSWPLFCADPTLRTDLGFVAGINLLPTQLRSGRSGRIARLFFGLEVPL